TVPLGRVKIDEITVVKEDELNLVQELNDDISVVSFKKIDSAHNSVTYKVEYNAGRIALCTLSAINWGNIKKPEDFEKPCTLAVQALDELLSYQEYPQVEAYLSTQEFRTLGVGINNLAYFLAKNNKKYDEGA